MDKMHEAPTLDIFLKKLIAAPRARQSAAVESALALLNGESKTPGSLLLNGRAAAKQLGISFQSLWRLRRQNAIQPVFLPGMNKPRYRRSDLEKLVQGVPK